MLVRVRRWYIPMLASRFIGDFRVRPRLLYYMDAVVSPAVNTGYAGAPYTNNKVATNYNPYSNYKAYSNYNNNNI